MKAVDRKVKEIDVDEFLIWKESGEDFQLIDVREAHEFEENNIGGELIPLDAVIKFSDRIKKDKKVVIHCRSGKRSATAIQMLEDEYGFNNLYNLKGGILEYESSINLNGKVA